MRSTCTYAVLFLVMLLKMGINVFIGNSLKSVFKSTPMVQLEQKNLPEKVLHFLALSVLYPKKFFVKTIKSYEFKIEKFSLYKLKTEYFLCFDVK